MIPCPNTPRCEHPAWVHDIDTYEDPRPICCVDDCPCGAEHRAPVAVGR